jgi:hypothetical protein
MKAPIDMILDGLEWKPLTGEITADDSGLPYATHEGILRIGGAEFRVYQLNTGQRVIDEESLCRFLGGEG